MLLAKAKKMVKIFMFVYTMILFSFLFLVVANIEEECVTDADCYKIYPEASFLHMFCIDGVCKTPIPL